MSNGAHPSPQPSPAGAEGVCKEKRRSLRHNMTDAERKLWRLLRDRRLAGFKFRRQHSIGPYIADFVCLEHTLVIEVDGGAHMTRAQHDAERTRWLKSRGYRVLRFWNNQALVETEAVLEAIMTELEKSSQPPYPLEGEGRGEGSL